VREQNKTIYRCEYCNKLYLRRKACVEHEDICFKNPKNNRPCWVCRHFGKKEITIYEENGWSEWERNLTLFHCQKKEIYLFTHLNQKKNNWFDLGDEINEPMPKECKEYIWKHCRS